MTAVSTIPRRGVERLEMMIGQAICSTRLRLTVMVAGFKVSDLIGEPR